MRPIHVPVVSAVVLALASIAPVAAADVVLPKVIGDHMVLQRNADAAIWGWAVPGERVRVRGSWMAEDRAVEANPDGRWLVRLPTPDAGGPHTVTITGENTITLNDVLIGEVWICGGQSNMEWPIRAISPDDAKITIAEANDPMIRLFEVRRQVSLQPRADCEAGLWGPMTSERAPESSAVAYFFAKELREKLGVPVGLIESNWGGTRVEAWMSPGALDPFSEYAGTLETVRLSAGDPGNRSTMIETLTERWWEGLDKNGPQSWTLPGGFDDSGWETMELPATLSGNGLENFDGVVRFRKTVDLPTGWVGKPVTLTLGPIDDYDDVWFNGRHIGSTHGDNQWAAVRKYEVPGEVVRGGKNTIAVRILDTAGPGGINGSAGQMNVQREDMLVTIAGDWKYQVGQKASDLPPRPTGLNVGPNTPTALYHGMITPLLPFTAKGAIWYQGESNVGNAARYAELFPAMIQDWRRAFRNDDLSFYFVQIAPFNYGNDTGNAARLRDSQRTTLALEGTGMAVTMDIGNPRDIHPRNKRDVGDRLARWALAKDYGQTDVVYSGPLFSSAVVKGNSVVVSFDHVNGGLVSRGGSLTHFTIAGADKKFVAANAVIEGDTIVVSSPDVEAPIAVRYGWGAADEPNLFNGAGLPASSFKTDDWD